MKTESVRMLTLLIGFPSFTENWSNLFRSRPRDKNRMFAGKAKDPVMEESTHGSVIWVPFFIF